MQTISDFGVSTKQAATHAVCVTKIEGTFVGDTASWIQIHDTIGSPANSAVPIQSKYVAVGSTTPQSFSFDFTLGELGTQNGLFVGVSSTEATYTAASKNMGEVLIELKQPEKPGGVTVVGDLSTGRNSLQVSTDSGGKANPRFLRKIDIVPGANAALTCIMLFCKDSPQNGDRPIARFFQGAPFVSGIRLTADLGMIGIPFYSQDADSTPHRGVTLCVSNTSDTLTLNTDTETYIRAEYTTTTSV